jgi:hypothetical protein
MFTRREFIKAVTLVSAVSEFVTLAPMSLPVGPRTVRAQQGIVDDRIIFFDNFEFQRENLADVRRDRGRKLERWSVPLISRLTGSTAFVLHRAP